MEPCGPHGFTTARVAAGLLAKPRTVSALAGKGGVDVTWKLERLRWLVGPAALWGLLVI